MELKTKYQYSYFIYPYVIKESKYTKYIMRLLKDKNCHLTLFEKDKNLDLYTYFYPKIRNYMFSSFTYTGKTSNLEKMDIDTQSAILAKFPCTIFEYDLPKDIQGKVEENSIFFKIQRIKLICFKEGICFLCLKTNIEGSNQFKDVLNFNYKFRKMNMENDVLGDYDGIKLQTDKFSDIKQLRDFIENIAGINVEGMKLDIDVQTFLTYSYVCIDQDDWNTEEQFDSIKDAYLKFVNILPYDNVTSYVQDFKVVSRWKYAKFATNKQGCTMFASSNEINNYTVLPQEFENKYFYTYILALYIKIYLSKLNFDFKNKNNIENVRKKFVEFTEKLWIQEITSEDTGTILYQDLKETLGLFGAYAETKNNYDVLYKQHNIEKNTKVTVIIAVLLGILTIINIIRLLLQ